MPIAFGVEMMVDGKMVDINADVRTFVYRESIYGSDAYMIHLNSSDWVIWDQIATDDSIEVQLRWYVTSNESTEYSRWRRVLCNHPVLRYEANGTEVWIDGTSAGFALAERCHKCSFHEKRVSEMVEKIAALNGLDSDVEPTLGKHSLYQCNLPDAQFIRLVLLPRAVDNSGRGGFYFSIRYGTRLVFRPPDLTIGKSLGQFTFQGSSSNVNTPESSVTIEDLSVEVFRRNRSFVGSYSTEFRGFDAMQKEPGFWVANDQTVPCIRLAPGSPKSPKDISRVRLLVKPDTEFRRPTDVKEHGIADWSVNSRSLFRTQLVVTPMVNAEPGRTVQLNVYDPNGQLHFSHGRWLVYQVEQVRRDGDAYTTLFLERRTYHTG